MLWPRHAKSATQSAAASARPTVTPTAIRPATTGARRETATRAIGHPRARPNDPAHRPAGRGELHIMKSLHAPPVRCSAWFGMTTARVWTRGLSPAALRPRTQSGHLTPHPVYLSEES